MNLRVLAPDKMPSNPSELLGSEKMTALIETIKKARGYEVKEIDVKPGRRVSLQRHARLSESWIVGDGRALATCGEDIVPLAAGESVCLPRGIAHRMENAGDEPLHIIEVQIGEYPGEDDTERVEDDWRCGETGSRQGAGA